MTPDNHYSLMCCLSMARISPAHANFYEGFGPGVDHIIDRFWAPSTGDVEVRFRDFEHRLREYADRSFETMPRHSHHSVWAAAQDVMGYDDVMNTVARECGDYLEEAAEIYRDSLQGSLARLDGLTSDSVAELAHTIRQERRDAIRREREAMDREMDALTNDLRERVESFVSNDQLATQIVQTGAAVLPARPKGPKLPRRVRRRRRKAVRRSMDMASRLIGRHQVETVARGGRIIIPGEIYDYGFELKPSCIIDSPTNNWNALNVVVFLKNGERLCTLCIYCAQTPVFDHLATYSAFISAGEELDLIESANIYNINRDAGFDTELITKPFIPIDFNQNHPADLPRRTPSTSERDSNGIPLDLNHPLVVETRRDIRKQHAEILWRQRREKRNRQRFRELVPQPEGDVNRVATLIINADRSGQTRNWELAREANLMDARAGRQTSMLRLEPPDGEEPPALLEVDA